MKIKKLALRFSVVALLACGSLLSVLLLNAGKAHGLLVFLQATYRRFSTIPAVFSSFHLSFLILCVLLTVAVGILAQRMPAQMRKRWIDPITFSFGIVFWTMETYKQIFSFYVLGSGLYDFALFPFQFCSLPIFFCLILPLLPEGGAKTAGYRFLALFGTVGGVAVVIRPSFSPIVSISLHTLVWHILMVLLGFFLLIALDCGREFRGELLPSTGVFLSMLSLATILNVLCKDLGGFNMFYLSPYQPTHFFLLSNVQSAIGWFPTVLLYATFVCLGAMTVWLIGKGLLKRRENRGKSVK